MKHIIKKYQSWYENGQLRLTCNYENGKINGLYQEWYENGQLRLTCNYENGKINGLYQSWHDNGQLWGTLFYINGEEIDVTDYGFDVNNLTNKEIETLMVLHL